MPSTKQKRSGSTTNIARNSKLPLTTTNQTTPKPSSVLIEQIRNLTLLKLKGKGSEHYRGDSIEMFEVALSWNLNWPLGNVLKYIRRISSDNRPLASRIQDIEKAIHYLEMQRYDLTQQGDPGVKE